MAGPHTKLSIAPTMSLIAFQSIIDQILSLHFLRQRFPQHTLTGRYPLLPVVIPFMKPFHPGHPSFVIWTLHKITGLREIPRAGNAIKLLLQQDGVTILTDPVLLPERLGFFSPLHLRLPTEWVSPELCPHAVSCSPERLIVLLLRHTGRRRPVIFPHTSCTRYFILKFLNMRQF